MAKEPKNKFYFLYLVGVIVVMFALQLIPGFTELLVLNGEVYNGEIWRFVSSIFLHGSLTHLILNLFALLFFGFALEKTIGSRKFLIVFFASGIIANLVSVNFYTSSLGASGAIYGVIGALALLKPMMMVWAFGAIIPMFIAAIIYVIADLMRTFEIIDPGNTGTIAHLSGIAIGIIAGLLWFTEVRKREKAKNKYKEERVKIPESVMVQWEDAYMKS